MPNENKKVTEVWKYFSKVNDENAKCNKCEKIIGCKGSSTSGLGRHLLSLHSINVNKRKCKEEEILSKKIIQQQPSILSFTKKQSLSEIVARLAALDGLSINAICSSQFIRQSLSSRQFNLPKDRKNVMNLVHNYFELARGIVMDEVKKLQKNGTRFCLTLDEWTSLKNRRYLNVNLHFFGGDIIHLGLIKINGSCTAEVAVSLVDEKLTEFGLLPNDIVASTTDGAAIMKKFGRISQYYHQQCYNHAIHLAVLDIIYKKKTENYNEAQSSSDSDNNYSDSDKFSCSSFISDEILLPIPVLRYDLEDALKNVRKVVKLFKYSPVKNSILQSYVKIQHGKELNLIIDLKIRWNSIVVMLERFIKLYDSIKKALRDLNCTSYFNDEYMTIIRELVSALKPIKVAVEALGRRDTNLIISEGILKFLYESLQENNSNISKEILESIKTRIKERRNTDLISLLRYFQNPIFFSEEQNVNFPISSKYIIKRLAEEFFIRLFNENQTEQDVQLETENEILNQNDDEIVITSDIISTTETEELNRRLAIAIKESEKICVPTTNNFNKILKKEMLLFEDSGKMPLNLEKLFNALKCIQPTSTESERVFSTSSNFCSKKRSNLSDKSINMLCFLKSYFLRMDKN